MSEPIPTTVPRASLVEVAALFLRLGTTAFGGPAAHIAIMEDEVVGRKRWLTREEFLDLVSAANLIPGPNSTELAIHIGYRMAGWRGLLVAGISFILPATLIVSVIAWGYVRYATLPALQSILEMVKPVVLLVIVQALVKLGRSCLKTWRLGLLAVSAVTLAVVGVHELAILFGTGLFWVLLHSVRRSPKTLLLAVPILPPLLGTAGVSFSFSSLFWFFVKVGAVLFGSGYVLVAFLRADLVERYGWLTEQQLLDAIAVGQVTPGPVFTTATFIGYLLGGPSGAVVATVGIFLPAFVFVALTAPILPKLRRSPSVASFLDGVNVASLALMAAVTVSLTRSILVDGWTIAIAVSSGILLLGYRLNTTWLIVGAALLGLVRSVL